MSESGPSGDDPFRGIPFLGDLSRMLQGQGPLNWDAARQFALMIAADGAPDANVDPSVRFQYQELARVAELHVQQATGLDTVVGGRPVEIVPVSAAIWAQRALDAYRPLFEHLAGSLGKSATSGMPADLAEVDETTDPTFAMFGNLMQMLSPMMLGMSVGSMVGHLSRRCFGQFDLPIPRPPSPELQVVASTIDRFGEDWSLPLDDLRLWVCLQELTSHAVLAVPHVRSELQALLMQYVSGFQPNSEAVGDKLATLDLGDAGGVNDLQRLFGDPEVLLGAIQSPEQRALLPRLDALVAVVIGYVDHTVDGEARGLVGTASRISEAARRRRVEADQSDVFVSRLLGLTLSQAAVERGQAFVAGVLERDGDLGRLWQSAETLPTPAEVDAPGLWLARIEL